MIVFNLRYGTFKMESIFKNWRAAKKKEDNRSTVFYCTYVVRTHHSFTNYRFMLYILFMNSTNLTYSGSK